MRNTNTQRSYIYTKKDLKKKIDYVVMDTMEWDSTQVNSDTKQLHNGKLDSLQRNGNKYRIYIKIKRKGKEKVNSF